jgi:glycosyltransferase involved in cell wall biosynthesis
MISVTILTKNCASTLSATLDSLQSFQEIIIYDTGSTDETLEIAKRYPNTTIHQQKFIGFGPSHNRASFLASHDWILSIDSDEVLSPELSQEILSLPLNPDSVYSLSRQNYYNGKHIKWCGGWYPDPVIRLYNRKKTRFSDDAVHEKVLSQGVVVIPLHSPLLHTPYRKMEDFLSKMQSYSSLFAKEHKNKKNASLTKAILHSAYAFFKSYFLKKGFMGGKEGFIISLYNSHTAFYKYLKLWEANQSASKKY